MERQVVQREGGLDASLVVERARHQADLISQQRLTRDRWTAEVDKMVRWGARIDDSEMRLIVDYLARYFGPC